MTRRFILAAVGSVLTTSAAQGAAPVLDDYAQGLAIQPSSSQPLVEITLPDVVYQTVTRADLGDVRVFNAAGALVPHALCTVPDTGQPVVTEQTLPVFDLDEARSRQLPGSRIELQTGAGTQIDVQEAGSRPAGAPGRLHIVDARATQEPLRAIQFRWQSPDGVSAVEVSIEASADLDRWKVLVPASTLLRAARGDRQLRRERIELPAERYDYLRVRRVDGGPPLLIDAVTVERVSAAAEAEPFWFMASAVPSQEQSSLRFDTSRLAPVRYARLRLAQENSSVRVSLESRDDERSTWRERWTGEAYVIVTDTRRRESPPARFAATTDRYWRLRIVKDAHLYRSTLLDLGYRPARLRFLAQGPAPFTLAFGSRRAEPAAATACDALLTDVSDEELAKLIAGGVPQGARTLGGDSAFKPLPRKTPTRLVVLWSVLVVGVGLLVAMAVALLKRVRSG